MKIILLGAPGVGKGTQAQRLCARFGLEHWSTGDMLRAAVAAKSPMGLSVAAYLAAGQLVPDATVMALIQDRMQGLSLGGGAGFLLDGFPRTLAQADSLERAGMMIDRVICIQVPDAVIIERLSGRRVHPASGRTYHLQSHPSLCDDVTGEPLVQRADDQPEIIEKRLHIYHKSTEPLMNWYAERQYPLDRISGLGTVEEVWLRVESLMLHSA